uniref:Uncharacterized protein n=1 Tax=Oryza meridionalis TaxID=40149 RepID=A0A0E0C9F6_9ORYZ
MCRCQLLLDHVRPAHATAHSRLGFVRLFVGTRSFDADAEAAASSALDSAMPGRWRGGWRQQRSNLPAPIGYIAHAAGGCSRPRRRGSAEASSAPPPSGCRCWLTAATRPAHMLQRPHTARTHPGPYELLPQSEYTAT